MSTPNLPISSTASCDCCATDTAPTTTTDDHGHEHGVSGDMWRLFAPALLSLVLLLTGLIADYFWQPAWFAEHSYTRLLFYGLAYIPVAYPVWMQAIRSVRKGDVFSEFFLMTIASVGAFAIGEYPEGVAVMLFYTVGENFQHLAVQRARRSIRALLDVRPQQATVWRENAYVSVKPETVEVGETVQVVAGERIPLDGKIVAGTTSLDTAALTGESRPQRKEVGETVLAGMVNLESSIAIEVIRPFENSALSKILHLVENAVQQKAPTETFIRRFARIYTPIVVLLATMLTVLPFFIVENYVFSEWLYRALVFLVVSCPCALVVSIPLGYFGGIGAASRNGILVKGSQFLDQLTKIKTVVMDKTGTLTRGVFAVQEVVNYADEFNRLDCLSRRRRSAIYPPCCKGGGAICKTTKLPDLLSHRSARTSRTRFARRGEWKNGGRRQCALARKVSHSVPQGSE